ncbi:hypothetical protein BJ981_002346 [Sphaerisporangium krabiense]|uniref:Uncharacterized protein n=1 Tax=Sphaerisporangium krabiense TaxID=763782 RepID=A0A7W9DPM8_9ACTN|nr:hypothetical protein [Sphaerisporangium krabiense]
MIALPLRVRFLLYVAAGLARIARTAAAWGAR